MKHLSNILMLGMATLFIVSCAGSPTATADGAPWYQRTNPKNGGLVGHSDAEKRFGCLFTGTTFGKDKDALTCFDYTTGGAGLWLVGLEPSDCTTKDNKVQCRFFVKGQNKVSTEMWLPLERPEKHVFGLQKKGSKALFEAVRAAGYHYTVSLKTTSGRKTASFTVPEHYR